MGLLCVSGWLVCCVLWCLIRNSCLRLFWFALFWWESLYCVDLFALLLWLPIDLGLYVASWFGWIVVTYWFCFVAGYLWLRWTWFCLCYTVWWVLRCLLLFIGLIAWVVFVLACYFVAFCWWCVCLWLLLIKLVLCFVIWFWVVMVVWLIALDFTASRWCSLWICTSLFGCGFVCALYFASWLLFEFYRFLVVVWFAGVRSFVLICC